MSLCSMPIKETLDNAGGTAPRKDLVLRLQEIEGPHLQLKKGSLEQRGKIFKAYRRPSLVSDST